MKRIVVMTLAATGVAYPFVVYATLGRANAYLLALPLACLWLLRAFLCSQARTGRLLPIGAACFCLMVAASGQQDWLRAYPVMVNALLFTVFFTSLRHDRPVIERLARLKDPELPAEGVRYTRRVTQCWTVFFACNGATAAALGLWAPWSWWTAYNGCISYLLIGTLIVGEWLIRPRPSKVTLR